MKIVASHMLLGSVTSKTSKVLTNRKMENRELGFIMRKLLNVYCTKTQVYVSFYGIGFDFVAYALFSYYFIFFKTISFLRPVFLALFWSYPY